MSSSPCRSVSAEIENMNLGYVLYSTLNKNSCGKYCFYSVQMYGVYLFCLEDQKYTQIRYRSVEICFLQIDPEK